jgi:hypothetical protein
MRERILSINTLRLGGRNRALLPELNTAANASSITNEADAVTGFNAVNLVGTGANVAESQSVVKHNGSYAFHTDANDTPTAGARFYTDLNGVPYSLQVGKTYRISYYARHIGTGGKWDVVLASDTGLSANVTDLGDIATALVTFTKYTLDFLHSANTRYFGGREDSATNNGGVYFDTLSIREIR